MDQEKDRQLCFPKSRIEVPPGVDMLKVMVSQQREFFVSLGNFPKLMTPDQKDKAMKDMVLADVAESMELLNEFNWKPWKKTKKPLDIEQARFEVIDKLCFLLNMAAILDMDADCIFQHHMWKLEENKRRQKNDY